MSTEVVAAGFTGLVALIGALAAYGASRNKRVVVDQRILRRQVRKLQRQLVSTVEYMFTLEIIIAGLGGATPKRPLVLEIDDDESDDPDPGRDGPIGNQGSGWSGAP